MSPMSPEMGGTNPLQARIRVDLGTTITRVNVGKLLTSHRLYEGEHNDGGVKVEAITSRDGTSSSIIILCPLSTALKLEKLYQNESKYFNHGK